VDGAPGQASLAALEAEHGKLPETARADTGGGGEHIVFICPPELPIEALRNAVKFCPGLDIRTQGGQVVVEPSVHQSELGYRWTRQGPIAAMPAWLHKVIVASADKASKPQPVKQPGTRSADPTPRPRNKGRPSLEERQRLWAEKARSNACEIIANTAPGSRNITLNSHAVILGHYVAPDLLDFDKTAAALLHAAQVAGLSSPEADDTIASGLQAGMRHPKRPRLDDGPPQADQRPPLTSPNEPANDQADAGYEKHLVLTADGAKVKNLANAMAILEHSSDWRGALYFDEFASQIMLSRPSPAHEAHAGDIYPRPWTDSDDALATAWLQRRPQLNVGEAIVSRAVVAVASFRKVHPVKKYLSCLAHDGLSRVDSWLSKYLGAEDVAYTRAVGRMWLISAVARIFEPGCKADAMLILEGPQGIKKSSALEVLASPAWFADSMPDLGNKDSMLQVQGKWIIEMSELDAMGRAEVARIKAFLSNKADRFRSPYGRHAQDYNRQCVFAGTVNHNEYLRDETGGRRFWPVRCSRVDLASLSLDRDQLWAEAVTLYRAKTSWWIEDAAMAQLAGAEQDARYHADAWEEVIARYIFGLPHVGIATLLERALQIEPGRWTRADQTRVGQVMTRLGWERRRHRKDNGDREWLYYSPAPAPPAPPGRGSQGGGVRGEVG